MGSPYGENQITVMVQGDTRPDLVRTLLSTDGATMVLNATYDAVKFRLVNKQTGQIVLDDVTAVISDGPNGQVTYSWDVSDTSVAGLYDEQWKIDWSGGGVQHILYPSLLTIRPLDDSRVRKSPWIMSLGYAKSYLGTRDSDFDLIIKDMLGAVTTFLSDYVGYALVDATYTHDGSTLKKLDGNGQQQMWLQNRPVTSLSALTILYETNPLITDVNEFAWYSTGEMAFTNGRTFTLGRQNIGVTYRAGYTTYDGTISPDTQTLPMSIIQVAQELMGRKMQEWQRKGPQVQSIALPEGGGTVTFALNELSKEQRQMLSPYVRYTSLPSADRIPAHPAWMPW